MTKIFGTQASAYNEECKLTVYEFDFLSKRKDYHFILK